ncbi:MAG: S-methyl-5'-thioadenosine phosphorylase [Deltaproteobacteria bacterium]|nr:S-methyl-5'-thioadenosine phosphorylase [Deltaproteobacteria bacterium]
MSDAVHLGVIGGSGLYGMEGVEGLEWVSVDTPFGPPSDQVGVGRLDGVPVAFLSRHGRGHRHAPHEINYRANIWALKSLGVRRLVSVSAVGSMREEIVPGDLVLVDQFIDRTRTRPSTFFEDGVVAHVMFSDPVCADLQGLLVKTAAELGIPHHDGGTYVCIEGPQFSTRAESLTYRSWDVSVVGMTNLPEARLAREAQMAYATIALATDYDCWHESEDDVSVEGVLEIVRANVSKAQRLVRAIAPLAAGLPVSTTWSALENAVMSHGEPEEDVLRRVGLLLSDREFHGRAS